MNALALLTAAPESPERDQRELRLRLLLGVPLSFRRGYGSVEGEENYDRARALCREGGAAGPLFGIVHAAWYQSLGRGVEAETRHVVEELAALAEELGAGARWRAALARGRTDFWGGHFLEAAPVLLRCVEEIDRLTIEARVDAYGVD